MQLRLAIIAPLFLLSGGTALLYQVAFGKKLATIFGATAYAVSAVLAAFMAGLALGSWLGGKYGGRITRPLVAYGVAEIVVGAVCALTPLLFDGVAAAYVGAVGALPDSLPVVSAVRGVITALVVLVPTVAMGITLPMLSRGIAGRGGDAEAREGSRRRLAQLYAINTAGGAIGALASAYLVLPWLGVYSTMRAAAVVNVAIGAVAITIGRDKTIAPAAHQRAGFATRREGDGVLAVLAAASGVLVFAAEVVDTHLLALLIGNSAYAFGLMLAAFLTCLSLGAALAQPLDRRFERDALPIALLAAGIALLVSVPIWGRLTLLFVAAGNEVFSWAGREAVRAGAAFAVLFLPTTCMGLTFPLLLRRVADRDDVARSVGRLTAINTLGSIIGSLACGYVVLAWLGSEWMMRSIAMAFALMGVFASRASRPAGSAPSPPIYLAAAATIVLGVALPRWDMKLMTNGANVYFDVQPEPDELVFVEEDVHGGLTSVARRGDTLTLYTNGKFQGDNGFEVVAQRSFAHFPSLFVEPFGRALVIGLGTGTTLGTIAAYDYEDIDVAELSPSIVKAARRFFAEQNHHALDDPRVNLMLNDGRNVLLLAKQPYDLVTIEVSSVWFAGAANLYSREFYELVRSRMNEGGVLQQWVQLHHIRWRELAVTLHTVRTAFEHVALFVSGGQGIIVAANRPLIASRAHLQALSARPSIAATLGDMSSLEPLLERVMLSGAELDKFVADGLQTAGNGDTPHVSTDENLYLEYATPKGNVMNYSESIHAMFRRLSAYRHPDQSTRHLAR